MSDLHDPSEGSKVKMWACVHAGVIREAFLLVNIQQRTEENGFSNAENVYFGLAISHHTIT